jgi:hypothetical protein
MGWISLEMRQSDGTGGARGVVRTSGREADRD